MAKQRIFTVGISLPGDEFEFISFDSDQTLLDADIILFEPTLGDYYGVESYNGRPLLTEHSSFAAKARLDHWRNEIVAAVNAGKLVIIYLAKPAESYRYTGEKRHSRTGRSRVTTNIVVPISAYEAVPKLTRATAKSGSEIRLEKGRSYLAPYWSEFADCSPYEVEIEGEFSETLLVSRTGDRVVGAAFHGKNGALLFLPPLRYDHDLFVEETPGEGEEVTEEWTEEALRFGKRLVTALVGLASALKQSTRATPPPDWCLASEYRLALESDLEVAISKRAAKIAELQAENLKSERQLEDAGGLRRLLYEQGKPLEGAILEAMRLFGFDAQRFADGESEFDGVFVSAEGRCLGEAEGKDNKPVGIEKFSQLERNLNEDFAREEVAEHAKGLMFGNAFRLKSVDDRGEFFTDKCVSAAKRIGAALIRTPDLFPCAKYLKEHPSDLEYATLCRGAIFSASGAVVKFPEPPLSEERSLVEAVTQPLNPSERLQPS